MQAQLRALLQRRTKRTMGKILGRAEEDFYPSLTREERDRFRSAVLDALNEYEGIVMDIIESLDTGDVALNELWLERLEEIWETVVPNPRNGNQRAGARRR